MLIRTITKTDSIEKESLEAHVEICAQRYSAIDQRLGSMEDALTEIEHNADRSRQAVIQTMVAGGTILAVVIPVIAVILERMK